MPSSTRAEAPWSILVPSSLMALFVFSEAVVDQLAELAYGLGRLITGGLDLQLGALGAAQQEHAHHALGVGGLAGAADQDFARILRSQLHELGRGAGVQSELVPYFERSTRTTHGTLAPTNLWGAVE